MWIGDVSLAKCCAFVLLGFATTALAIEIREVDHHPAAIDPGKGETCTIRFTLDEPAAITLDLYDGRDLRIRTIESDGTLARGPHSLQWDGRDEIGRPVPPEAYHYTLTARSAEGGRTVTWDTTDVTGLERNQASGISWVVAAGEIRYELPRPSRVNIRVGWKEDGLLLATLLDWVPRVAGQHRQPWDGYDDSHALHVADHPMLDLGVNTFELPSNSVIVLPQTDEVRLIEDITWDAERRPSTRSAQKSMYDHRNQPIELRRDYDLIVDLLHVEASAKEVPRIFEKAEIRVDLEPAERLRAQNERFEIVVYVDGHYVWESELGYLPMTYVWDPTDFTDGIHYITINLRGYEGHFGTATLKLEYARR
jgi:hypothetical protein